MSSKPIDYSKWDNLEEYSDDDSSSAENEEEYRHPRVTKIDKPGKVTRSSDGTITIDDTSTSSNEESIEQQHSCITQNKQKEETKQKNKNKPLTNNGDFFVDTFSRRVICWAEANIAYAKRSQDMYEVSIAIPYDTKEIETKSIGVTCTGVLPYMNKNCATTGLAKTHVDETHGSIAISAKSKDSNTSISLLKGTLPHFVHASEDEEEANNVDWSIECNCYEKYSSEIKQALLIQSKNINESGYANINLIRITLFKAVPMEGMFIWWEQPLEHCRKIDLDLIEDRKRNQKQRDDARGVWEEAHELFRQKIQSQQQKQQEL